MQWFTPEVTLSYFKDRKCLREIELYLNFILNIHNGTLQRDFLNVPATLANIIIIIKPMDMR